MSKARDYKLQFKSSPIKGKKRKLKVRWNADNPPATKIEYIRQGDHVIEIRTWT
jgi:hypothetical protein